MVGEHIRALKGGRWNHAIDCGDETVIHLADEAAHPTRVRRAYRPEFVAGAEVVEVVTHRERTFPAAEVVARAYSRIADPGLSATFRDSEAFADWCVTGRLATAPPNVAAVVPGTDAPPAATATPPARSAGARKRKAAAAKARRSARAKASRTVAPRRGGARKATKKKAAKKTVRGGRATRRR